jgi:large exoprotein involved in heme utilization and adhesion
MMANNYDSTGNSGNLTISASESVSLKASEQSNFSYISTDVYPRGAGKGSNLTITTGELLVRDGSQISSGTYGAGDSGDLSVIAERVEVSGLNNGSAGGLFTSAYDGTGNGGNLTLTTEELLVRDGGQIFSGTYYGTGNGGNLTLTTGELLVKDGGQIFSGTYTAGNGGDLTIPLVSISEIKE